LQVSSQRPKSSGSVARHQSSRHKINQQDLSAETGRYFY
jgi:hypothetical protein